MKNILYIVILCAVLAGCGHRPSKVEQMRAEKAHKDSITYVQALQNRHYSDSLLQLLLPEADELLRTFNYAKDDKAEDHGHYVHPLLQTTSNTSRNFLQAYVSDNRRASVQSYYFGSGKLNQHKVRVNAGEDYVEAEGSPYGFEAEGWHEILTIEGDDALRLLAFIARHSEERVRVTAEGQRSGEAVTYYLNEREKEALSQTYRLAVVMSNIDALERAISVSDKQINRLAN